MKSAWYKNAFRRNVIDMHISDWDERFLKDFDAKSYVDMLVRSNVQSTVLYANSCVGLCYYPTKIGKMHQGTCGRNFTAEVIEQCHKNNIAVVVYYGLIFDNYAWSRDTDWRVIDANGNDALPPHKGLLGHRFQICCPNSPYRDYVRDLTQEICRTFEEFEGIRFDMTFWPTVCYCRSCREKFRKETGSEIPRKIDWYDKTWVALQRCRERWLTEFAMYATEAAREIKPQISVEHQASTFIQSWRSGIQAEFTNAQDFLQGDFYGDKIQGVLARKLFYNLSQNLPFGFETSYCIDITNHTAKKSEELLEIKMFASIADSGAFIYIDGIDCEGTLNPRLYETTGRMFKKTMPYEPYIGGQMCQDVGIYFSCESKFDFNDSGKDVMDVSAVQSLPHVKSSSELCRLFTEQHVPFGVITRMNLEQLDRHKIIVLANILMMDEKEASAIREFVKNGGCVFATKYSSLVDIDGTWRKDFLLSDVFGVSFDAITKEAFTYIAPVSENNDLFDYYTKKYPLAIASTQMKVRNAAGTKVLGELVLPWSDPAILGQFASQHSNPPAFHTDLPAIVMNSYGKGKSIYVTGDLEDSQVQGFLTMNLLRLFEVPLTFEIKAPKPVQCTAFHQPADRRYILSMLNHQAELPNIPVDDMEIRFLIEKDKPKNVFLLPEKKAIPFEIKGSRIIFKAQRLETFSMYMIQY